MRTDMIYSPSDLGKKEDNIYVFLAGPIKGAPDWRTTNAPKIPGVIYLNPQRQEDVDALQGNSYTEQVDWETLGLRMADIVVFWIPKSIPGYNEPGRYYAQTTKFELCENLVRWHKKRLIIGIDPEIELRKYMCQKISDYKGPKYEVFSDWSSLEAELRMTIRKIKETKEVFFTSDTHFDSQRTLELSKRPFPSVLDMNLSLIERWNSVVTPGSVVYHLGDFGNLEYRKYLNGDIRFIKGNYEESMKDSDLRSYFESVKEQDLYSDYRLTHKPSDYTGPMFHLYGHIHGRQIIRKNSMDVGCDCHDFCPLSLSEVQWYRNAIENHYDFEVFGNK